MGKKKPVKEKKSKANMVYNKFPHLLFLTIFLFFVTIFKYILCEYKPITLTVVVPPSCPCH